MNEHIEELNGLSEESKKILMKVMAKSEFPSEHFTLKVILAKPEEARALIETEWNEYLRSKESIPDWLYACHMTPYDEEISGLFLEYYFK